jgi:hypothetical protein
MLFIDYEKASDRVPRGNLWNIIKNKSFPDHRVVTALITNISDGRLGVSFTVTAGRRQRRQSRVRVSLIS